MERLTERNADGSVRIATKCPEGCRYVTCSMEEGYQCNHECEADVMNKLADYEQAEKDGLLKMFPVAIGSDVYYIPSKVNYKLNVLSKHEEHNRVYHQKVERISFNQRGWYLECDKDLEYGTGHILVDIFYKETWFTTESEAEQALAKMKGET